MVHKRYVYRNGKKYGPYLYENKRVGEKVISKFVGKFSSIGNDSKINVLIFFALFMFVAFFVLVSAVSLPSLEFVSPTPLDDSYTSNTSVQINVSILDDSLNSVVYSWDSVDYSIFNESLQLMLNFDDYTRLNDTSLYYNNGSCSNCPTFNNSGKYNGAYSFDGVNDVISFGAPAPDNLLFGSNDFTISAWVSINSTSGNNENIMQQGAGGAGNKRYLLRKSDADVAQIEVDDDTSLVRADGTTNINDGNWHHLVGVRDSDTLRIFVDGIQEGTGDISGYGSVDDTEGFFVGSTNAGNLFFNGTIDEVRVWNRSLSGQEIYEEYASNLRKHNSTQWYLYVNQSQNATTGLSDLNYEYSVNVTSSGGNNSKISRTILTGGAPIYPLIEFVSPTPSDGSFTSNDSFLLNVSLVHENLRAVDYSWNGFNYSFLNDSLQLMLNFDDYTRLNDTSRYGNNGTNQGATYVASGKYNGAYSFDGSSDYIDLPDSFELIKDQSISVWINTTSISGTGLIVGEYNSQSNNQQWRLYRFEDDLIFEQATDGSNFLRARKNTVFSTNTWHHIVAVYNDSDYTRNLYFDGEKINFAETGSGTYTGMSSTPENIEIGSLTGGSGRTDYWSGMIDELMIWNRTLNDDEAYEIYASNLRKHNSTQWYLYVNQSQNATTGLAEGTYTYSINATEYRLLSNQTETRTFSVGEILTPPLISFESPTPLSYVSTTNSSIEINVSIIESNVSQIIYNWNGTSYSLYNDSLVLMLNFDNRSSLGENDTYVRDLSTYDTDIYVEGAVWNSTGKYMGAYSFDGVADEWISLGKTPSFSNNTQGTVSAWVNTQGDTSQAILTTASEFEFNRYLWLRVASVPQIRQRDGDTADVINGAIAINDGEWHHVVFSSNGTSYFIYVDGVQDTIIVDGGVNNGDWFDSVSTKDNFLIGATNRSNGVSSKFNGTIDEVRVWNRSLSGQEIYQDYVSNLAKYNASQWYLYVNQSQNATTALSVGNYTYYVNATDSSGNNNQTETRVINITAGTDTTSPSIVSLVEDPSDPATYSSGALYMFNATVTDANLDSVLLEFDGTNYTTNNVAGDVYNLTLTDLSAGDYSYVWRANDTSGNVNTTVGTYTINNATGHVAMLINGTAANQTIVYGSQTNVSANTSYGSLTLLRDGSSVASENHVFVTLGVGDYNYTAESSGDQNHSSLSLGRFVHVVRAASEVNLTLNATEGNISIGTGDTIVLNGTLVTGDSSGTLRLYNNGTLINEGTGEVSNSTLFSQAGDYNITIEYVQSQNYTKSVEYYYVNVTVVPDTQGPIVNLISPSNGSTVNSASVSFQASLSDNIAISNATFFLWNQTGGLVNTTLNGTVSGISTSIVRTFSLPSVGTYFWNFLANDTSGNSAFNSTNWTVVYAEAPQEDEEESIGSSGGGGSGGGGNLVVKPQEIDSIDLIQGYTRGLRRDQGIKFKITNPNGTIEYHEFRVKKVLFDRTEVILLSEPYQTTLFVGDLERYDLNNDDFYDLSIKVNSIVEGQASFTLRSIYEAKEVESAGITEGDERPLDEDIVVESGELSLFERISEFAKEAVNYMGSLTKLDNKLLLSIFLFIGLLVFVGFVALLVIIFKKIKEHNS